MNTSAWPIVFVHSDQSPLDRFFLAKTITQAAHANPLAPIHLICSLQYNFDSICHHHQEGSYYESSTRFAGIYDHMSATAEWYDLACIQRWLVLEEFCKKNKLSSVIYVESDVMLYSELIYLQQRFAENSMTLSLGMSSPINFIANCSFLTKFKDFVFDFYNPENAERRRALFAEIQRGERPGMVGISDMTLLLLFNELVASQGSDTFGRTDVIHDGGKFDHNINVAESGEVMGPVRKKIEFVDGRPFAQLTDGQMVQMHSLHFQGAKHPIDNFTTYAEGADRGFETSSFVDQTISDGVLIHLSDRATHRFLATGWAGAEADGVCARGDQSWIIIDLPQDFPGEIIRCRIDARATYGRVPWRVELGYFCTSSHQPMQVAEHVIEDNDIHGLTIDVPRRSGQLRYRIFLRHHDVKSPLEEGLSEMDWRDITVFVHSLCFSSVAAEQP